jgi:serine/threonine protein kinase
MTATAIVLLAEDVVTSDAIVIKCPRPKCSQTSQEISILPRLSHPGIISLLGVTPSPRGLAPIFPFMANGDLLKQIQDGPLPEEIVKRVMYQLFKAVAYLHRQGVWHRDLKPENILFLNNDASSVVITDFGLSICPGVATLQDGFLGTLKFSAPELIANDFYSEKVDIWSLGLTMLICQCGCDPWGEMDDSETLKRYILYSNFENIERLPNVSENAMDLMKKMLTQSSVV